MIVHLRSFAWFWIASLILPATCRVDQQLSASECKEKIVLSLRSMFSPPNRLETNRRLSELRQNRSEDSLAAHLEAMEERRLQDSLKKYNVPVDSFMTGSINVEVHSNGQKPTGSCATLEIIATSVPSLPGNDTWNGKFCRYYDVCLGSLIDDCRYAGGKLKCETTDQYPNGFVSLKAEKGVAMFDFLTHRHSPDMRGRRIHFEVKGCPDINVETEEVIISNKGDHLRLVQPSALYDFSETANTPLPSLEVVIMYKDSVDGQMKKCTTELCGNDAEVNIDVTIPRELNGEVLKTFNPKNQKLLNSSIMLGGEYMKIQAWSGDSAVRQQAKNGSAVFTGLRVLDVFTNMQLNFTASQSRFFYNRVPMIYSSHPSAVLLSPSFNVTPQRAVCLHITNRSNPTPSTVIDCNFPFAIPMEVQILDENNNVVTSGPDSRLVIVVSAGGACLTGRTMNATRGVATFMDSVCYPGKHQLNFTAQSSFGGPVFSILSNVFSVREEIRIGLLAPQPGVWDFFGSTFSTMVTLALEDINDPDKFKEIFHNRKGRRKLSYVVAHMPPANETTNIAPEIAAIRGIMDIITQDRIHLLLGPTLNLDFDSMAMMPGVFNVTQVGLFPQGERFTYQQRYPFLTILGYSFDRFGQALAHFCHTHMWKRIAVIWNSKLPVPRSFRQEAANLGLEIVADEYILGVDSVPNVPNLEELNVTLDDPDYKENFERIRRADVDVILSFPFSQDCWHLYKQAIKYGIAPYHGFQWVAAGTLAAMSYPRDTFYSCSIPENVTCSEGFSGMALVVQYLLRDLAQFELWTELERRVNILDPTEYDLTIQYPTRFTFLILGMVYDAVVLFMKAVSDLIERNSTLTAAAITQQMRSTGFRGIFPGPLSFEGGDRSGYRGVVVHIGTSNKTVEDNSFQLNYEINYGFELSIPPGCDQTECRRLNYFRLVPNYTVVPEEVWPKGKKVEKRYFRGIDSSTKLPMFGNSSSSVTFECANGCGGGHRPVDDRLLWIPGECDDFKSRAGDRQRVAEKFQAEAVDAFLNTIKDYYQDLVSLGFRLGHKGIMDNCSDQSNKKQCDRYLEKEFPLDPPNFVIYPPPSSGCQAHVKANGSRASMTVPDAKCLYFHPLCSAILLRCNIFRSLTGASSQSCNGPTDIGNINLLEVCHIIPSLDGHQMSCLGLNVTGPLCEALALHDYNCSQYPHTNLYNNGICKAKDQCECETDNLTGNVGWTGDTCSNPVCAEPNNCIKGDCIRPSTCACYPGYRNNPNNPKKGQCSIANCSDEFAASVGMGPGGPCQNDGICSEEPSTHSVQFRGKLKIFDYELLCRCSDGFKGNFCEQVDKTQTEQLVKIIVPSVAISFLLVVMVVAAVQYKIRRMRIQDELANTDWRVKWEDLFFQPDQRPFGWIRQGGSTPVNDARTGSMIRVGSITTPLPECAIFKGQMVAVKRVNKIGLKVTEEVLAEIRFMRSTRHVNIIPFIGVCIDLPHILLLTEYTTKGSLRDVLSNADIRLDWGFRYSLARDLAQGMDFLHHSDAQWHGRLTSNNCLIDSHWVLKITDFGLHRFKQGEQPSDDVLELQKLLWVSPELLVVSEPPALPVESMISGLDPRLQQLVSRSQYVTCRPGGTKPGDVYSFGMILYELMMRQLPFFDCHMSLKQVIAHVQRDPEFRPTIPENCPVDYCDFMQTCWADCPEDRPPFGEVLVIIKRMHDPGTLVDNMVQMLEKYSSNLEHLVEQRTQALADEKSRSEELLYQMIPKKVAQQLKAGSKITAEQFEEVTVCFCDIVGFTRIAANSTPLQVISLLNDLYSRFDRVIDDYNVFKLGTIGDAYIIVAGLPERTGPQHAPEIANTALDLMASVNGFKIKHFPDHQLQLRIGIHSGPCVAGVVGLKVPHYCVFGDTVNIASRMESTGLALRIHLSSTTTRILRRIGGYHVETRGKIIIKGRGPMVTAWLLGRDGFDKELPSLDSAIAAEYHDFKA